MNFTEHALVFDCEGEAMVGIICESQLPAQRGVLIVVGGPQYRVGSHRQFALLARYLAERGVPALRFDYRGMGDSDGEVRTFESVGPDIRRAIDQLFASAPNLKDVVIWALCDAASAALFYAHQDKRVSGLVLLNPWVRTEQGLARAHLKHYYLRRLFQPGLWRKLASGNLNVLAALNSLGAGVASAIGRNRSPASAGKVSANVAALPDRMEQGLSRFQGRVLLILSGNDLTAREFEGVVEKSPRWRKLLDDARVTRFRLPKANHTFSSREWRDQVAGRTESWLKSY